MQLKIKILVNFLIKMENVIFIILNLARKEIVKFQEMIILNRNLGI